MENFKEALIQFSQSNPALFPNEADNSYPMLIEQCFHQFFADFQTPDHPTYSAMIYRAIWELNKKGGSSEKSISKFIKKEYADLPWAHTTLLKHHLQKLCDRHEICMTHKQCYLLAGAETELETKNNGHSKKRKKQKTRLGSEASKKISTLHKNCKKKKKCLLDIQETSIKEQIGLHKRKRKLKSEKKSSKCMKKHMINEEIKFLLNEANLKQDNNESRELKQMLEVNRDDIQIQEQNKAGQGSHHDNSGVKEQIGLNKRKKKQGLKLKRKSSMHMKKNDLNKEIKLKLNEANLKQDDDGSREQQEKLEVNRADIQMQEQNEMGQESHRDNSGVKEQLGLNKKRKQGLESKRKSSMRVKRHAINEEIKLQLNEAILKQDDDDSREQKEKLEVNRDDIRIQEQNETGQESRLDNSGVKEQIGLLNKRKRKRKRKLGLKLKRKSSMHVKKHPINEEIKLQVNEGNLKQINDVSHNMNEVGHESHHDISGHVDLEQIQTKMNPELLQPEESPDSNLVSHGNDKRVWTRSQLKTTSKKDASDKPVIVENLSNEEQQISSSPSSKKPLVELSKSISSKLTRLPGDEPTAGQRSTEKSTVEDKPMYKRRGRRPKSIKPEKDDVLGNSKSAAILGKSQKSVKKGKVVNKKVQSKQKCDVGHTMTMRSSRKPSN